VEVFAGIVAFQQFLELLGCPELFMEIIARASVHRSGEEEYRGRSCGIL
jgi:hypothetical protein